jgi:hypothetical protein
MHCGLSPREHIMVQKEHCLKTYLVVSHGLAWVLLGLILFLCGCASGTSRKTSPLTIHNPEVTNAISSLGVLSNALAKSSSGVKRMPELLGQARATALADIEGQRVDAQAFFRAERLDTMETLKQERIATVAALDGERLAAVADLRKERQIVLNTLHNERVAMTDLHAASEKALRAFDANSRSLIDHFYLRAAELVLLTLALCFLAFWILLRRFTAKFMDRGRGWSDRAA